MYKSIRVVLAVICFLAVTLLFLDFTGFAHHWWGWLAKIQVVPAVLALNAVAIIVLLALTLIFGRIYCSVICPLGVMQDVINHVRGWVGPRRSRINRFKYKPALTAVRLVVLAVFVVLLILGLGSVAGLIEPYSEYGRIASSFMAPVYDSINNILADESAAAGTYTFYHVEAGATPLLVIIVAAVTLAVVGAFAWLDGRGYCNTICPVGTVLGYLSKFSLLRPVIDTTKCNGCTLCARNCKASCIDAKAHRIDYTRCVACMDCIHKCHQGAISYTVRPRRNPEAGKADTGRRAFIATGLTLAGVAAAKAERKLTDGGLAPIVDKVSPERPTRIVPPGAVSIKNLSDRCTACQLCISACPNGVLRPSTDPDHLLQPEVSFERGYCRPECTSCSEVCPAGAIVRIDTAQRSAIHVGRAIVDLEHCISANGTDKCGNCSRKCPAGAITMVPVDAASPESHLMPVVNESLCIGCGACENLCPVRPLSAITVDGYEVHRIN